MSRAKAIVDALLEWHANAKLEVASQNKYGPYFFYRNGQLAGEIGYARERQDEQTRQLTVYIAAMGVQRSLQRTGLGNAMLQHVLSKFPDAGAITLDSAAHQFYHKLGGQRRGRGFFTIPREKLKASPFQFTEIPWEQGEQRRNGKYVDHQHKRYNSWAPGDY